MSLSMTSPRRLAWRTSPPAVDPSRLGEPAGTLTFDELRRLGAALRVVLDL
jgi:hypothetical protein